MYEDRGVGTGDPLNGGMNHAGYTSGAATNAPGGNTGGLKLPLRFSHNPKSDGSGEGVKNWWERLGTVDGGIETDSYRRGWLYVARARFQEGNQWMALRRPKVTIYTEYASITDYLNEDGITRRWMGNNFIEADIKGKDFTVWFIELGEEGPRGYSGSRGYTGSPSVVPGWTGSRGDAGSRGYTGSVGPTGYIGSDGYTGSRGFRGSQGYTGSPGKGFTGSEGDRGYTGSKSFTGSRGYSGSPGAGLTGSQGVRGYSGSKGDRGYTGSIGKDGGFAAGEANQVLYKNTANVATGDPKFTYASGGTGKPFELAVPRLVVSEGAGTTQAGIYMGAAGEGAFQFFKNAYIGEGGTYHSFNFNGGIIATEMKATIFTGTATRARYADLAEVYETDHKYPIGTVVKLGGIKEATIADAGTKYVLGVISDRPAYLMNSDAEGQPIALIGRVKIKISGRVERHQPLWPTHNGEACNIDNGLLPFAFALESGEDDLVECLIK